jgi:hypothetical protein
MTDIDLGAYADDPRIQVLADGTIRAEVDRIRRVADSVSLWHVWSAGSSTVDFSDFTGALPECLAYALGDPCPVGPVGIGDWLHTDGRVYKHNPATTGMKIADYLREGDVVDFPHIDAFVITGPATLVPDDLGRLGMGYPAQWLKSGFSVRFPYRSGDMVPVRFAR